MPIARVLLINPKACSPRSLRLPLSLLSLAAVLQGSYRCELIDGNVDPSPIETALRLLSDGIPTLVAVTVMPGPQVAPAIEISRAVRARCPEAPIVWGGYFPTLYSESAINAPYVDYVIRGQGEATLIDLLDRLSEAGDRHSYSAPWSAPSSAPYSAPSYAAISEIKGLTWKHRKDGLSGAHEMDAWAIRHNPDRPFIPPDDLPELPYDILADPVRYLRPSFLGSRTAVHQASIGCRYRCSFCGVASMFSGHTRHQSPERVAKTLTLLRDRYGADSVQFYDHNFFDREEASTPLLEALSHVQMPYWCYARADALANLSVRSWELARKSRLRMAYIGAEAASDQTLKSMRKGTRVDQTLEAAARCREFGVIPEFSFILGGPEEPEENVEQTLKFIRRLKAIHPECEVILYFYSPTPQRDSTCKDDERFRIPTLSSYGAEGPALPTTPEEWTEPRWISYVCHQDAPWLSDRLRRRVQDFSRVLACRFPTAQDHRTPIWGKAVLRSLASWRYASQRYDNPRELAFARRLIPLREPQSESL